jgi:putative sigma-54 modulation protein
MNIQITGRNVEVTPALKEFTEEKLQRLEHHDQHITQINVILHIDKVQQIAEGTVHLNKIDFHAKAEAKDLYEAIDAMANKLLVQVTKHKEKTTDHHR